LFFAAGGEGEGGEQAEEKGQGAVHACGWFGAVVKREDATTQRLGNGVGVVNH
jgi:hypothetical protein